MARFSANIQAQRALAALVKLVQNSNEAHQPSQAVLETIVVLHERLNGQSTAEKVSNDIESLSQRLGILEQNMRMKGAYEEALFGRRKAAPS